MEREVRLLPLSPADREVAQPNAFSRANARPSPSCPSRCLQHTLTDTHTYIHTHTTAAVAALP